MNIRSRPTAHKDTFVTDHLPRSEHRATLSGLSRYPQKLNAAAVLLDRAVSDGARDQFVFRTLKDDWSYGRLLDTANRIAHVLVEDLGVMPGHRVLLRAPNHPFLVACWLAVLKVGGVAVPTMPLLRTAELLQILRKARINAALCDCRLEDELRAAQSQSELPVRICSFHAAPAKRGHSELHRLAAGKPGRFHSADTYAIDPALILFTSGTTGEPKAAVHFHRDLIAVSDHFPRSVLRISSTDVHLATSPLAFAYGLGAHVLFPMRYRASAVLLERSDPEQIREAISRFRVTNFFSTPTAYRMLMAEASAHPCDSLKVCVSAGEPLPPNTFHRWQNLTGLNLVDGIGTTELLHIFMSTRPEQPLPGSTGTVVPGYEARILGEDGESLPAGVQGALAVRGPTGCKYLADERQADYVVRGWNLTGDLFTRDKDNVFWFQGRADDLIVTSGYKIAAREIEDALLSHEQVAECAVVGVPDTLRGHIVKAFIVPKASQPGALPSVADLQAHVKSRIAPYKYPREIQLLSELPKTQTGKIRRHALRDGIIPRACDVNSAPLASPGSPNRAPETLSLENSRARKVRPRVRPDTDSARYPDAV